MCVTNTARRRPVAKLPASILGGGHGVTAKPTPPGVGFVGGVYPPPSEVKSRLAQERAQELLLRQKHVSSGGGGSISEGKGRLPAIVRRAVMDAEAAEKARGEEESRAVEASGAVNVVAASPPPPPASSSPSCQAPKQKQEQGRGKYGVHANSTANAATQHTAYEHGTVVHAYHDHATDPDTHNKPCTRGGVTCPFPTKLHAMLDAIERDGFAHVISWQPHGRAFLVHNSRTFVEIVMPRYFKQTKMASFQRQLNLYGFQRITAGVDRGAYYHELFLRGMPYLAAKMQRKRVKGTGVRMASSPDTEPNFYAMKPVNRKKVPEDADSGARLAQRCHKMQQSARAGALGLMPPLSKSTLQSFLSNPLAKVHPLDDAALRPKQQQPQPQPVAPFASPSSASGPAAAMAMQQHPVVTPCSVQRPRQSMKELQRNFGVSPASVTSAVPPPPLAFSSEPPRRRQQHPSGPAFSTIASRQHPPPMPFAQPPKPKLDHLIHRPAPPAQTRTDDDAIKRPGEEDEEGKEKGLDDSNAQKGTPFERSMLQYLDPLQTQKDAAASLEEDPSTIGCAMMMEPLPFRIDGADTAPVSMPPRLDFPESEFIRPRADGCCGEERGEGGTVSTDPASLSSSLGSSPSSGIELKDEIVAAAIAAESKNNEEHAMDGGNDGCKPHLLDIDIDDIDVDDMPVPKHLLSPKSKEAEMDRFLEELFRSESVPKVDPLDPGEEMDLSDEALGYLLDDVVGE